MPTARFLHNLQKVRQYLSRHLFINTDPAFNGHGNGHNILHSVKTICDQFRFRHQASPEPPRLHPVRWATDIEVYLIITIIRPNSCPPEPISPDPNHQFAKQQGAHPYGTPANIPDCHEVQHQPPPFQCTKSACLDNIRCETPGSADPSNPSWGATANVSP